MKTAEWLKKITPSEGCSHCKQNETVSYHIHLGYHLLSTEDRRKVELKKNVVVAVIFFVYSICDLLPPEDIRMVKSREQYFLSTEGYFKQNVTKKINK